MLRMLWFVDFPELRIQGCEEASSKTFCGILGRSGLRLNLDRENYWFETWEQGYSNTTCG